MTVSDKHVCYIPFNRQISRFSACVNIASYRREKVPESFKNVTTVEETKDIILNTIHRNLANTFDRLLLEEEPDLLDRMEQAWQEAGSRQGYPNRDGLKTHWRERERLDGFRYNILPHLWNGKDTLKLIAKFEGHPKFGNKYKEWKKGLKNKKCENCGETFPARLRHFYSNGAISMLSPMCKTCQDAMGNYQPIMTQTAGVEYLPTKEDCEQGGKGASEDKK